MSKKNPIILIMFLLVLLDAVIWYSISFNKWILSADELELYFFDVGQGDSQMITLPDGIKVLIDGGTGSKMPEIYGNRYIDLVIMTHPQLDHFGGLIDVVKNYEVGTFIANGRKGTSTAYQDLIYAIKNKKIPYIVLVGGDKIKYKNYIFDIISPEKSDLLSNELNDGSLVIMFKAPEFSALYAADIGINIEERLAKKYDLSADILKVSHHGSKFSSEKEFLSAVSPKVSIIEVGKNNYGHPTKQTLNRLANINSAIFRTDQDGTIKIIFDDNALSIYN